MVQMALFITHMIWLLWSYNMLQLYHENILEHSIHTIHRIYINYNVGWFKDFSQLIVAGFSARRQPEEWVKCWKLSLSLRIATFLGKNSWEYVETMLNIVESFDFWWFQYLNMFIQCLYLFWYGIPQFWEFSLLLLEPQATTAMRVLTSGCFLAENPRFVGGPSL